MITLGYGGDVDLAAPLEKHDLNEGRVVWLNGLPGLAGGPQWVDLCGRSSGTLVNSPTWAPAITGGAGLKFNGSNSNVAFANGPPFATTVFTFAAWVLPISNGATWRTLVEHNRLSTAWWGIWQSGSSAGSYVWTIGAAGSGNTTTAGTITVGVPQRLVMTMDGSTSRGHINGTQVFSAARAPVAIATGSTRLGTNSGGSGEPYDGTMWDVCFAARAWSLADVQADYDLSRRGYPGVLRRLRSPVSLLTGGYESVASSDAGIGAEFWSIVSALVTAESATGGEGGAVVGRAATLDSAASVELASLQAALASADAGAEAIAAQIAAALVSVDQGAESHALALAGRLVGNDQGAGLEGVAVRGELVTADGGAGGETSSGDGPPARPLRRFRVSGRPAALFSIRGRARAKYRVTGYAGASQ